jgi:uncharacterized FlgJ-related protein
MTWLKWIRLGIAFWSPLGWSALDVHKKELEKTYTLWSKHQHLSRDKKCFVHKISLSLWLENCNILYHRLWLGTLIEKHRKRKPFTLQEKKLLKEACTYYKVSHWKYLVNRMDVVPVSMAVAQSIQECGWGRSSSCVKKNAYFGMCRQGVCHKYDSLVHSVRAYVRTLNTHRGYVKFREKRRIMRERQQDILGSVLIYDLHAYCTDAGYSKLIHSIIRQYRLSIFDLMLGKMYGAHVKQTKIKRYYIQLSQAPHNLIIVMHRIWSALRHHIASYVA